MIRNYFKVALRNLQKHKGYSFINIFGLAVGLACCFLITIYVNYEFSYDQFHDDKESIYRVIPRAMRDGAEVAQTWNPSALAGDLQEMREIEYVTRLSGLGSGSLLTYGEKRIGDGKGIILADSSFFRIFTYPLVQGNPGDVLDQPFEMVISESFRDINFPGQNPVGEVIRYDGKHDFVITGIMEDMPSNSHLSADIVASFISMQPIAEASGLLPEGYNILDNYDSWNYSTYVTLPSEPADQAFQQRMNLYLDQQRGLDRGQSNFTLQPLGDIHFERGIRGDAAGGDMNFIYIFSAVALFILLIAGFNFVNLTTAKSVRRAKEVGVRKSLGASKMQLMKQFVGESVIISVISITLALLLLEFLVPGFARVMNSEMTFSYTGNWQLLMALVGIGLFAAVAAGFYPAFYLSAFNPMKALKNQSSGSSKNTMRKVLTGLQFGIASFLIIGLLTVNNQMQFIQDKDLGFDKEQVVYMNPPQEIAQDNYEAFKSRLEQYSFVEAVTRSNKLPGMGNSHWTYGVMTSEGETGKSINTYTIDPEFVEVLGLEIVDGTNFSWDRSVELREGYLINETAARVLGLDDSVNSGFRVMDGEHPSGRVIGVVKDFNYNSLHKTIEPLVMWYSPGNSWTVAIRMNTNNLTADLETIRSEWASFAPGHPMDYTFLDDRFEQQYQADKNFNELLAGFTLVGIIISCLGLLGLTSYIVEQRTKEIGIRKVLGASVQNILALLSTDFVKLVIISFIAVVPLAYITINSWLQNFAYKIDQSIVTYMLSGLALLLIALITISYQSVRAAHLNPVVTLKDE